MQVRAICTHYNGTYRKEGDEFPYDGPLYEHIEPVDLVDEEPAAKTTKPARSRGSYKPNE